MIPPFLFHIGLVFTHIIAPLPQYHWTAFFFFSLVGIVILGSSDSFSLFPYYQLRSPFLHPFV